MKKKGGVPSDVLDLIVDRNTLRVKNRESEHREFKLVFENNNIPKFAKAMSAFSNRDGGVLFFGIKDRPRELIGVVENEIPDDVVISNFLKEYFQPEISFSSVMLDLHGKKVHALIVTESSRKPVICKKSKSIKGEQGKSEKEILREGAVYYRYSASSEEIKYAELMAILDHERESFFRSMIDNITLLNRVGHDRAAVVDAKDLSGNNQTASVYLTNDTAKNLNWIDKGSFVKDSSEGSSAYYVVRNVEIKHGVEIIKPTDFAQTHPLTKTALMKEVKISGIDFDGVTWKLGIKDNPVFHIASNHGKNRIHKFTVGAKDKILSAYPLSLPKGERKYGINKVSDEYKTALRS